MTPDPATIHRPPEPSSGRPAGWDGRLARWLSILAHPFGMLTVMMGALAARRGGWLVALEVVAVIWGAMFVPLGLYVLRQVSRGRLSGVDASIRQERPRLFLLTGVLLAGLLVCAFVFHARGNFAHQIMAVSTLIACAALGNYWIKLSMHMACAAYATTVLLLGVLMVGLVMLPVTLALGWARVRLGRHTWPEVGVGAMLGVTVALTFAWFVW